MINKFQASMLAFAIGDALAAPIEGYEPSVVENYVPLTEYIKAKASHPLHHLEAGQYSDETQMMLLMARSLTERGIFDVEDLLTKFSDWYYSQRKRSEWRFPGDSLYQACKQIANGADSALSGMNSAGVAPVMRTLPLILVYGRQPEVLGNYVRRSCALTHLDRRVGTVSMMLASVIEAGLSGAEFKPAVIMASVLEASKDTFAETDKKIKQIKAALASSHEDAAKDIRNTGYAIDSFTAALYWFLKGKGDFDATIVGAANGGGDCDAIAALAGAMYGSWFGMEKISSKWLSNLEGREEIKALANKLYRLAYP
ncbi:MAG: hypothetical protein GX221_11100 [Candidatus Riflebacteria bacterium]|nr:hypothetical protein [Candidatus Riflebacteria bacterium]